MSKRTPMMQQYHDAKELHPEALLAMRVGDFYEFYGDDAVVAAELLAITLTGRDDSENGRVAMAGVPYHSIEKYLARLVQLGRKVALCDQIENPKTAKGLVKRAVTRVLTPGTLVEDSMLQPSDNNFLAAFVREGANCAIAIVDPSTGEILGTEFESDLVLIRAQEELSRVKPSEILVPQGSDEEMADWLERLKIPATKRTFLSPDLAKRRLLSRLQVSHLGGYGAENATLLPVAIIGLLEYLESVGLSTDHINGFSTYNPENFLSIDGFTRRTLEITSNLMDGSKKHTLLGLLDICASGAGSRLLRKWLEFPLTDPAFIERRLDAVQALSRDPLRRSDIRDAFKGMSDIERLVSRCSSRLASPRDLHALKNTLNALPLIQRTVSGLSVELLNEQTKKLTIDESLRDELNKALADDPPTHLRDGGTFRTGFHLELDRLREIARDGRSYIAELQTQEREATGIANLKVGFNNVFGYFFEVPKSSVEKVPDRFTRKQTTANAERYVSAELKERETTILNASEQSIALETELFDQLRERIVGQAEPLLRAAGSLATLDVLTAFAEMTVRQGYKRPEFSVQDGLEIKSGRHPVVEANQPHFVANDLLLDESSTRLIVLTGPNMSGKSTFLRQSALIVLMAQCGCFVPARKCVLSPVDRIFARMGAKDEISLGQSTFMVEMLESAYILNHSSPMSLILLDEVGRGTSTYDGLAIAWAMAEFLAELNSKVIFATHYHQLNAIAEQFSNVKNFQVSVSETGEDIVWTHRVIPGSTDRSYGLYVAKRAGMPRSVLSRAEEVLAQLEGEQRGPTPRIQSNRMQLSLFELEDPPVVKQLRGIDVESVTPLQALQILSDLKQQADSK